MSAPRSKETTLGNPKNFKGTNIKKSKNYRGFRGGAGLLNHFVQLETMLLCSEEIGRQKNTKTLI